MLFYNTKKGLKKFKVRIFKEFIPYLAFFIKLIDTTTFGWYTTKIDRHKIKFDRYMTKIGRHRTKHDR